MHVTQPDDLDWRPIEPAQLVSWPNDAPYLRDWEDSVGLA